MKKYKLIYLIVSITLLLQGCSNDKNKELDELTGTLLWPTNATKIIGANLKKSLSEPIVYYGNGNYKRILFPSKTENSMLYVAVNEKGENEIIEVVNGNTTSLVKKQGDILYPVMLKNQSILYVGVDKEKKTYLGQFVLDKKSDKVLKSGNINTDSRPSVSLNGSILFVEEIDDAYWIELNEVNCNTNTRQIVKGRYPVWLEDDKKFIYYYDRSIRLFDLSTNKTQIIEKGIVIKTTPVLSPDRKLMAIFQPDTVAFFGGETLDYLRIMPISGGKKINVKAHEPDIYYFGGLEWIK